MGWEEEGGLRLEGLGLCAPGRLAELCSREAESTLAWPQVYWTALKFKGR